MSEKVGIKETKEALLGTFALAIFMAERLRDGVGVDDAAAFIAKVTSDSAFIKLIEEAYDKVGDVPAEIKDIDLKEAAELLTLVMFEAPKLISAIQGKAA